MSEHPGEEPRQSGTHGQQPPVPPPAPPGQPGSSQSGPYQPGPYQPGPYQSGPYPPSPYQPGPYPPGAYPPGQYQAAGPALPNHPKATLALALGITGVAGAPFFCGLTLLVAPFAWGIGHRALREIRASGGRLGGESPAQAGMVMGIIGTVLLFVFVIVVLLVVVGLAAVDFTVGPTRGKAV